MWALGRELRNELPKKEIRIPGVWLSPFWEKRKLDYCRLLPRQDNLRRVQIIPVHAGFESELPGYTRA